MKKKLFLFLSMLGIVSGAFAYTHRIINHLTDKKNGKPIDATIKVTVLWGNKEATTGKWRNTQILTVPAGKERTFSFKGAPCLNYIAVKQPDGSWKKVKNGGDFWDAAKNNISFAFPVRMMGCENTLFELIGLITDPVYRFPTNVRFPTK